MTFYSNVQPKRTPTDPRKRWVCGCHVERPGYWVNCPDCGRRVVDEEDFLDKILRERPQLAGGNT